MNKQQFNIWTYQMPYLKRYSTNLNSTLQGVLLFMLQPTRVLCTNLTLKTLKTEEANAEFPNCTKYISDSILHYGNYNIETVKHR